MTFSPSSSFVGYDTGTGLYHHNRHRLPVTHDQVAAPKDELPLNNDFGSETTTYLNDDDDDDVLSTRGIPPARAAELLPPHSPSSYDPNDGLARDLANMKWGGSGSLNTVCGSATPGILPRSPIDINHPMRDVECIHNVGRRHSTSIVVKVKTRLSDENPWQFLGYSGRTDLSRNCVAYNAEADQQFTLKIMDIRNPMVSARDVADAIAAELLADLHISREDLGLWIHSSPFAEQSVWQSDGRIYMVKDISLGDLSDHAHMLTASSLKLVIAETLLGISYLHEIGIIHTNIQPSNIIIGLDGHCRISNFEFAKFFTPNHLAGSDQASNDEQAVFTTFLDLTDFSAPELRVKHFGRYAVTVASDYWSLGASIFAVVTRNASVNPHMLENVKPHMTQTCLGNNGLLIDFVQDLCSPIPHRLTGDNARRHLFLVNSHDPRFWFDVEDRLYAPFHNIEMAPIDIEWPSCERIPRALVNEVTEAQIVRAALEARGIYWPIPTIDSFELLPNA